MFWRFSYSTSQIQTLLEKQDVTLQEIMDEEDVLQECKSNNEKLIEMLTRTENLNQLVSNVVTLPPEDADEKTRFKNASISCELLTCDIGAMNDALVNDLGVLDKLYSFLQTENELNPLMASYFAKVVGCLISRKTESFLNYMQTKDDFLSLFLRHVNTSAVMDIILRLLTTIDSNELRLKSIVWLKQIKLIRNLIDLFKYDYQNQMHSNAGQLICDIIRISREQILSYRENNYEFANMQMTRAFDTIRDDDKSNSPESRANEINELIKGSLLEDIESQENIEKLLDLMLESIEKPNCSLTSAIEVLLTILEPKTSNYVEPLDLHNLEQEYLKKERDRLEIASNGIKTVVNSCIKRLNRFHQILVEAKPRIEVLSYTNGKQLELLGMVRLNIIKLIVKLMSLNRPDFNEEIIKLGTINSILDMTFKFKWNNFLHLQVANMISNLLSNDQTIKKTQIVNNKQDTQQTTEVSPSKNQTETSAINQSETEDAGQNENEKCETDEKVGDVSELKNEITANVSNQKPMSLLDHFLRDCKLINRLINAWNEYFLSVETNAKEAKINRSTNVGYIGHLTVVTNLIHYSTREGKNSSLIQSFLNDYPDKEEWNKLIETKVAEINKRNSKDLVKNPLMASLNDLNSNNDFVDMPNEERLNKKFLDLQKEVKINCVEDFSLSESQIINFSTKYTGISSKSKNLSFQLESNDDSAQMFEQICSQRDNMNLAMEKSGQMIEEDIWVTQEIKFSDNYNSIELSSDKNTKESWLNTQGRQELTGSDSQNLFQSKSSLASGIRESGEFFKDKKTKSSSFENETTKKFYDDFQSSSSSSSSSVTSSSSDDDENNEKHMDVALDENTKELTAKAIKKKRHHHDHIETKHSKSSLTEASNKVEKMDFSTSTTTVTTSMVSNSTEAVVEKKEDSWADFDSMFKKEEATEVQAIIDNSTSAVSSSLPLTDPWSMQTETATVKTNPIEPLAEKTENSEGWANFDSFN